MTVPSGIEKLHQVDVDATLKRDVDALIELWDDNGVLLQPGHAPVTYPMLLAAGAVAIERFAERRTRAWLKPAIVTLMITALLVALPLGVPVLSADAFLRYESKLPFALPVSEKGHRGAAMPQYYSDQFGWQEMTATVARVYNALSPDERGQACIGADNYGEAGAIDFFGPKYGLPNAISGHQNYFFWGPHNCTGKVLILLGNRPEPWRERCDRPCLSVALSIKMAML